jgi:hypothetical protein
MFANTEQALSAFSTYVQNTAKKNLASKGKNATGNLSNSINVYYKVSKNSFQLTCEMLEYGEGQDLGVRGQKSSKKAPNSPYKMEGSRLPTLSKINQWVVKKGIAPRSGGKFAARKSMIKYITQSIIATGLKPSYFLNEPFNEAFKKLPDDVLEKYGLDFEGLLKTSLKNGKQ